MDGEMCESAIYRYNPPLHPLFLGPKCSYFLFRHMFSSAFDAPSHLSPITLPLSLSMRILTASVYCLDNGSLYDPVILNWNSSLGLLDGIPPWDLMVWSHMKLDSLSGSIVSRRSSLLVPSNSFILAT